jgi:hypothetical protein
MSYDNNSGLNIDESEFMSLPQKKQLCLLYKNQRQVLELLQSYKFAQKIQYVLLSAALAGVGILFKIHIGI